MIKLQTRLLLITMLVCSFCFGQSAKQKQKDSIKIIIRTLNSRSEDTSKINTFLFLSNYFVNKPGSEATDMKAALFYANEAFYLSHKLRYFEAEGQSYVLMSQISREKGHLQQGVDFSNKALYFISKHPLPSISAAAYFEAANYEDIESPKLLSKKIILYRKGLQFLELAKPPPLKLGNALKFMGDLYQYSGQYQLALPFLQRALSIYLNAHKENLQEIYSLLGSVMVKIGDHQEGVRYNLMAVEALELNNDSTMTACETYCNLADAYNNIRDVNHARKYFQKAKLVALKNHEPDAAQYILCNIAESYNSDPKKALLVIKEAINLGPVKRIETYNELMAETLKAYTNLRQYNQAKPYYEYISNSLKGHLIETDNLLSGYEVLMKYLIATRQYSELRKYQSLISFSPKYKPAILPQLIIEHLAFQVDSALGNYFGAMKHSQRYMALNVANLKNGYDQKVASLEVKYATKSKDQDIAFKAKHIVLLTHQNQLQKETLTDQRLIRNLIAAATGLLVLLLVLGYSRYRIKRNANIALETNQLAISAQNVSLREQQQAINAQNQSLKQLVTEREWLLREVHHRVKNNLQIIMSLLRTQLSHLKTDDAKDAIAVSENRVQAIALIHQKLYNTDNMTSISMPDYVAELVNYLSDGLNTDDKKVRFSQSVDLIQIDLSQAVPIGLILNEAITNAIKHCKNDDNAEIRIKITSQENKETIMIISDNGKGLPEDFDLSSIKSLGMQMMKGLTRQLKGVFDIQSDKGVIVTVKFNLLPVFRKV
jgi:two-component sensor histidine kinase